MKKCNPNNPKAKDPNYVCNPETGRWVLKKNFEKKKGVKRSSKSPKRSPRLSPGEYAEAKPRSPKNSGNREYNDCLSTDNVNIVKIIKDIRKKDIITDINTKIAIARDLNLMIKVLRGSGIYIIHDPVHTNFMRVLIIGPSGSDYDSGCYELSVFMDNNYPKTKPNIKFITKCTSKLVSSGGVPKIDLLKKWSSKTKLVDILVSIKMDILGVKHSYKDKYHLSVRESNLENAVIGTLVNPTFFGDMVAEYLICKKGYLLDLCDKWEKEAEFFGIPNNINEYKKILNRL